MTIPRWRLALAAGALATAAAVSADVDATAAAVNDALLPGSPALVGDPSFGGTAAPAQLLALRDRLAGRLANIRGHLVHATVTITERDGKLETYQLDHGTVSAAGSGSITVAEAGGSSVTVANTAQTRVRKDGKPALLAGLKIGDEVVVRSTIEGGAATARLVVVPPAGPATTAPSSGGNG